MSLFTNALLVLTVATAGVSVTAAAADRCTPPSIRVIDQASVDPQGKGCCKKECCKKCCKKCREECEKRCGKS